MKRWRAEGWRGERRGGGQEEDEGRRQVSYPQWGGRSSHSSVVCRRAPEEADSCSNMNQLCSHTLLLHNSPPHTHHDLRDGDRQTDSMWFIVSVLFEQQRCLTYICSDVQVNSRTQWHHCWVQLQVQQTQHAETLNQRGQKILIFSRVLSYYFSNFYGRLSVSWYFWPSWRQPNPTLFQNWLQIKKDDF